MESFVLGGLIGRTPPRRGGGELGFGDESPEAPSFSTSKGSYRPDSSDGDNQEDVDEDEDDEDEDEDSSSDEVCMALESIDQGTAANPTELQNASASRSSSSIKYKGATCNRRGMCATPSLQTSSSSRP